MPSVLVALLVAVPAAQARHRHHAGKVTVSNVTCMPGYVSVTCSFTTSAATAGEVLTGTHKKYTIALTDASESASHSITVRGLEPGMSYYAGVSAVKNGKVSWTSFTTLGPGTDGGAVASVTMQGTHALLNGQEFIPIVAYSMKVLPGGRPSTCVQGSQVATVLATGARIVLVDQPYTARKHPPPCGTTPSAQIAAMHANLNGRLWWNIGIGNLGEDCSSVCVGGQRPLTRDTSQPDENEVVNFPVSHSVSIGPRGYGPWADQVNILSYDYLMNWWLPPIMAAGAPALAGIYLPLGGNSPETSRIPNQFWTAVGLGAGIDYHLFDLVDGNNFDPDPKRVALANKLSSQLATVAQVMLYGRPVAIKQQGRVPTMTVPMGEYSDFTPGNMTAPRTVRVTIPMGIRLQAWRYGGHTYLLAVGEGFYFGTYRGSQVGRYLWRQRTTQFKLKGMAGDSVHGLFGAGGLTLKSGKATLSMKALDAKWFVLTPNK